SGAGLSRRRSQKGPNVNLELTGKTALVTGGSQGIGRAIAFGLAAEGARVAICARDKARLEQTADEVKAKTRAEVLVLPGDLSRLDDVNRVAAAARDRFGRLDILINNAGSSRGGHGDRAVGRIDRDAGGAGGKERGRAAGRSCQGLPVEAHRDARGHRRSRVLSRIGESLVHRGRVHHGRRRCNPWRLSMISSLFRTTLTCVTSCH